MILLFVSVLVILFMIVVGFLIVCMIMKLLNDIKNLRKFLGVSI